MKKLLSILAIICSVQLMASTQLTITPYSGSDMQQDIALIGKWIFSDNNLQLIDKAGQVIASESIDNIRKITFGEATSSTEQIPTASIVIYPNPTHDMLLIRGIEAQPLRVYDLQGKILLHEHGTQIQVNSLATGTYLLQIGTQVVRFIKQ